MAEPDGPQSEPPPTQKAKRFFKGLKFLSRSHHPDDAYTQSGASCDISGQPARARSVVEGPTTASQHDDDVRSGEPLRRGGRGRTSRSVVPGLPRAQTFKRQLSEDRSRLAPVEPTPEERRAVSMDRRSHLSSQVRNYGCIDAALEGQNNFEPGPEETSYGPLDPAATNPEAHQGIDPGTNHGDFFKGMGGGFQHYPTEIGDLDAHDLDDGRSVGSLAYHDEQRYADMIARELETSWILNLSMRYKDRSNREKFFVTYRQEEHHWRRVTVTLDYRNAPEDSLEEELRDVRSQREKSHKIYEAIRQSLQEIQFYETVTNLKLETTDDRLHVHVVEDVNEIIQYPIMSHLGYLGCRRIKESDIVFDYHMSGFVYKVHVDGVPLIKKEIPGPETIDEFLYEINALNSLRYSENVIQFYGLVVDDHDQVKGLLISYADGGALIDVIYDSYKEKNTGIRWSLKERWARQIVGGLADVHECGFVQGDFTLSNIVIDEHDNAKIIDINRRGCPVGWEPPEATPLIESQHRISMYIGVKSDLYQLGMVLWAIAMGEDEPDREGRPLQFDSNSDVPDWYRQVTEICLSPDPRKRLQACMLLQLFPLQDPQITVEEDDHVHKLPVDEFHPLGHPQIRVENLPHRFWSPERSHSPSTHQSWHYAPRGRSPPSPMPSNYDESKSPGRFHSRSSWAANRAIRASYSDAGGDEDLLDDVAQEYTPNTSVDRGPVLTDLDDKDALKRDEFVPKDEAGEDAQATPTQETIGSIVVDAAKGDASALQETAGNAAKAAQETESTEQPIENTEASEKPDIVPSQSVEIDGKEAAKMDATETADLGACPDAADKAEAPVTTGDGPEIVEGTEKGPKDDLELPKPINLELALTNECAKQDSTKAEVEKAEKGAETSQSPDLVTEFTKDTAEAIRQTADTQDDTVPPGFDTTHGAAVTEANVSEQQHDVAGDSHSNLQETHEKQADDNQLQEAEITERKPTAIAAAAAADSTSSNPKDEEQPRPDTAADEPETHIDFASLPSKDDATPRISPSLTEAAIGGPEISRHVEGESVVDEPSAQKDVNDDDFQLVDRPPQTIPTMTVTTETATTT